MKIFIYGGAGTLGSCIAQAVARLGIAREIVLCDVNYGLAKNHAMDLEESVCLYTDTHLYPGSMEDLDSSDIVIVTAAIPTGNHNHMETMTINAPLLAGLAEGLKNRAPNAVVITVTNPVDVFNYFLFQLSGLPAKQFIGFSLNDTIRFRRMAGKAFNVPAKNVEGYVIGEHGPTKVYVFSSLRLNGNPLEISQDVKEQITNNLISYWDEYINHTSSSRTAGWTTAYGVQQIVEQICGLNRELTPCSCVLDGQYGLSELSIGVPAKLAAGGVVDIAEIQLSGDERAGLEASAEYIKTHTKKLMDSI
jgi:malate dehydrogenase